LNLRLFVTGAPSIGKSTVVRKVLERLRQAGFKVGGMTSGDLRSDSGRVGFEIRNLLTEEAGVLAHINQLSGPRVGRYRVKNEDLDKIGAEAIVSATKSADLIIIDEVGPMELTSPRFKDSVQAALASAKSLLGTVHRNAQDPLARTIRSSPNIEIVEVTLLNRDSLPDVLVERFRTCLLHSLE